MKNIFKVFFLFMLAGILMCTGVYAADDTKIESVLWEGDYTSSNMDLVIKITTLAPYNQQFTVAMYPAGGSDPGIGNYTRMADITVPANGTAEARLRLSDSLNADGAYKVLIQGNGYLSDNSRKEISVYVLRPMDINGTGLLYQINTATNASDLQIPLTAADDALGISNTTDTARLNSFLDIRNSAPYNGSFSNMNDVRDAWNIADIIVSMKQSISPSDLETKVLKSMSLLSINTKDADYIANKTAIYTVLPSASATYNNNSGVHNIADLTEAFKHASALAAVNNATIDNIGGVVSKYYSNLGIGISLYQEYTNLVDSDKQTVLRQLVPNKNFADIATVATAFSNAVHGVPTVNTSSDTGSSGGKGSGSSSIGGFSVGGSQTTAPINPPVKPTLGDCGPSHWAYSYVNTLLDNGIITGYSDGNFYPDKQVTREEFIKMIILAADIPSDNLTCDFADVDSNEWYYRYIAAAKNMSIIMGDDNGKAGIGDNILREDVAVIVYRTMCMLGIIEENTGEPVLNFTDSSSISEYAVMSVHTLEDIGILNGFEDGSFRPRNYLTRAEAAKIICLLLQRV